MTQLRDQHRVSRVSSTARRGNGGISDAGTTRTSAARSVDVDVDVHNDGNGNGRYDDYFI